MRAHSPPQPGCFAPKRQALLAAILRETETRELRTRGSGKTPMGKKKCRANNSFFPTSDVHGNHKIKGWREGLLKTADHLFLTNCSFAWANPPLPLRHRVSRLSGPRQPAFLISSVVRPRGAVWWRLRTLINGHFPRTRQDFCFILMG